MSNREEIYERALKVIRTWANSYVDSPADRERTLRDIVRHCDRVLDQSGEGSNQP